MSNISYEVGTVFRVVDGPARQHAGTKADDSQITSARHRGSSSAAAPCENKLAAHDRAQADLISRSRAESYLNRAVPLGVCQQLPPRPERGPTVAEYYRQKHAPSGPGPGRFYPLHLLAVAPNRR